jgi:hypothetical protein
MVAEELGRFLENQPVQARAIGPAGKAWRWCQRKPGIASGDCLHTIATGFPVRSLALNRAGNRLVTPSRDATVTV